MSDPQNDKPDTPKQAGSVLADSTLIDSYKTVLVDGKPFESWPKDLFIPPDALEVCLEAFQGPLDLLLYLIRKQNIDILNIPVVLITRQYMKYVELMRKLQLDLAAEYLVMAATLAEIKSRVLLPHSTTNEDEEGDDPRVALVRQLQEYERFSKAGEELGEMPRLERDIYLANVEFDDSEPVKVQSKASLNDLVVAFRHLLETAELNKRFSVGYDGLTIREKMTHILEKVHARKFIRFEDLFIAAEGRLGLVVSFMAILELVKDNMLVVIQNEPFSSVHIQGVVDQQEAEIS